MEERLRHLQESIDKMDDAIKYMKSKLDELVKDTIGGEPKTDNS